MSAQRFQPGDRVLLKAAPDVAWTVVDYVSSSARFWLTLDGARMQCREDEWILAPEGWQDIPTMPLRYVNTRGMTQAETVAAMRRADAETINIMAQHDRDWAEWNREHRQPLIAKLAFEEKCHA